MGGSDPVHAHHFCILRPYFPISKMMIQQPMYELLGFPDGSDSKESACNAGDAGSIPGSGRSPGERRGYPPHVLAWRIPWTEEPGGLSMGLPRVGHD